jgi:hypothetical protein
MRLMARVSRSVGRCLLFYPLREGVFTAVQVGPRGL